MSILLGLLIGAPFTTALLWRTATLGSHSFWELFAYAFGVLFIFNIVDLLILDWLIVCWIEPRWVILPGTEHIVIPKQYLHHFKGFLMGTVGLVIVGLAIAALLSIQFSRSGSHATDLIGSSGFLRSGGPRTEPEDSRISFRTAGEVARQRTRTAFRDYLLWSIPWYIARAATVASVALPVATLRTMLSLRPPKSGIRESFISIR
jgi:hypothetical protein